MLPFRKILFPIDYSDACQAIIPHVKNAVKHFKWIPGRACFKPLSSSV